MSSVLREREALIIGAGGFAAEIYSWAKASNGIEPIGFVVRDDTPPVSPLAGVRCYIESEVAGADGDAFVAIGEPHLRQRIVAALKRNSNLRFPNLIHPSAIVDESVRLGEGNLVLPNTVLCAHATVGSFNVINIYASLGHEAVLGDFNTLSPYATLNGRAACDELCFLGTHATLGPSVQMGKGARLSANSFGRKDIPAGSLAFGVPAKIAATKI